MKVSQHNIFHIHLHHRSTRPCSTNTVYQGPYLGKRNTRSNIICNYGFVNVYTTIGDSVLSTDSGIWLRTLGVRRSLGKLMKSSGLLLNIIFFGLVFIRFIDFSINTVCAKSISQQFYSFSNIL